MSDYVRDPEGEINGIEEAVVKYRILIKTTHDQNAKRRYKQQIKKLEERREQLLSIFMVDENNQSLSDIDTADDEYPFLTGLTQQQDEHLDERYEAVDKDVRVMGLYKDCFEREFLPLLSEQRLKLDFEYSYERGHFYNNFQEFAKNFDNYLDDAVTLRDKHIHRIYEKDLKKRKESMRTQLMLEVDRFFRSLGRFTRTLILDCNGDKILCRNAEDSLNFDSFEGETRLKGLTVYKALLMLEKYAKEVVKYLNIPDAAHKD